MTEQINSEFDLRLCFKGLREKQSKTRNNKANAKTVAIVGI